MASADRTARQPATQRLRQRHHVGLDAEALGRAAGRDAEPGLHLVEDQDDAAVAGERANGLEVPRFGQDDAEVHHRRLHDHAGGLATFAFEGVDARLHRIDVVEGDGNGEIRDRLRDACAVGDGVVGEPVADPVVGDPDGDHHAVVVAVVGAEDLHDRVAPRVAASDADRVHRRLGARVGEAPLREPEAARQLLADCDRVLGWNGEVRAEPDARFDRGGNRRVGVTLDHRSEAVVEVDALRPVHVPHGGTFAVGEVDRPRIAQLIRRCHAGREDAIGSLVRTRGGWRRLVEPLLLALGQRGDAGAVDGDGRALGHGVGV